MYAVIFTAQPGNQDTDYVDTAIKLRELAMTKYGCTDFISTSNDQGTEVSISYWPDLAAIKAWKDDPIHVEAQAQGRARWYTHYKVEVVEIKRRYEW